MLRELAFISSCGQAGAGAASRPHSLYRPTKDNARKHGLAWPGWCLAGVSLYVKVCVHPPLLFSPSMSSHLALSLLPTLARKFLQSRRRLGLYFLRFVLSDQGGRPTSGQAEISLRYPACQTSHAPKAQIEK